MNRRTSSIAVTVATLVVGAGIVVAFGGFPAVTATPGPDGQTISVGASGSAEGTPDQAILSVAVVATADSADAARQQVAADADANARTLAAASDLSVVGVHSVSTSDVQFPRYLESAAVAADGADTVVESGPVTVSASVQVTYNATSA